MTYENRKPLYDAYKKIVQEIIDEKVYKEYAQSEIEGLNNSLMESFKQIANTMLLSKNWPEDKR